MTDSIKDRLSRFNPAYFEFTEIFDSWTDRFDLYIITDCMHLTDTYQNHYVEINREV